MLPYLTIPNVTLGPFTLHVWGMMVALGCMIGLTVAGKLAKARHLDPNVLYTIAPWSLVGAFIGARIFHILFYEPSFFLERPAQIFAVWNGGLSIFGGFIGASLVGYWLLKRQKIDMLAYADVVAFGLPLGTFVGRIGCFLTHLHPGKPTNFFLGVLYPDGIVRHDLGFYLSLNGLLLFFLFLILSQNQKKLPTGSFLIGYLLWYGLSRFLLDFLRANDGAIIDMRYLGLTPAQYLSIVFVLLGIFGLWKFIQGPLQKSDPSSP